MKKFILLFSIIISASTMIAQHDIKVNALGLFFKHYGLGYQYNINAQFSAGVFINYSANPNILSVENFYSDLHGINNASRSDFSFSPEIRYYLYPTFWADSRYIGAYFRYRTGEWKDLYYMDSSYSKELYYNMNYSNYVIGILTGYKWLTSSGIYIETYTGFGRAVGYTTELSTTYAENHFEKNGGLAEYEFLSSWDLRFQIAVGYRIGGY